MKSNLKIEMAVNNVQSSGNQINLNIIVFLIGGP